MNIKAETQRRIFTFEGHEGKTLLKAEVLVLSSQAYPSQWKYFRGHYPLGRSLRPSEWNQVERRTIWVNIEYFSEERSSR